MMNWESAVAAVVDDWEPETNGAVRLVVLKSSATDEMLMHNCMIDMSKSLVAQAAGKSRAIASHAHQHGIESLSVVAVSREMGRLESIALKQAAAEAAEDAASFDADIRHMSRRRFASLQESLVEACEVVEDACSSESSGRVSVAVMRHRVSGRVWVASISCRNPGRRASAYAYSHSRSCPMKSFYRACKLDGPDMVETVTYSSRLTSDEARDVMASACDVIAVNLAASIECMDDLRDVCDIAAAATDAVDGRSAVSVVVDSSGSPLAVFRVPDVRRSKSFFSISDSAHSRRSFEDELRASEKVDALIDEHGEMSLLVGWSSKALSVDSASELASRIGDLLNVEVVL